MPKRNSVKVEKVVRKVEGLSNLARLQKDAGARGPSRHAGMAPQREVGSPVSPSYSRKTHTRARFLSRRQDQSYQLRVEQVLFGGARSTGAREPAWVAFQRRGNEQAWKEHFYDAALQEDQFEYLGNGTCWIPKRVCSRLRYRDQGAISQN